MSTKVKGIRKSVEEFNSWQGHAEIMFDIESGKVWCDVFGSSNEWKRYRGTDVIYRVVVKGAYTIEDRDDKVTVEEARRRIIELIERKGVVISK